MAAPKAGNYLIKSTSENPCLHCGACCAYYRVSFYWGEAEPALGGKVPPQLTEELTGFRRCMKDTNQKWPRCIALEGEIGKTVRCAIHSRRPTICRQTGIIYRSGVLRVSREELERCNRARAAWGLPPLSIPVPANANSKNHNPSRRRRRVLTEASG